MSDQKNPKGGSRDLGTSPDQPGERPRTTGSISTSRPGTRTSGTVSGVTHSGTATKATGLSKTAAPPKATGGVNLSALMKGGGGGTNSSAAQTGPKQLTDHQKKMLGSAFQDSARMNALKTTLGNTEERKALTSQDDDDEEPTALGLKFDGVRPAIELTSRDLFKAVQAPVQSRPGRRSREIYKNVIFQFAVGNNPRYVPEGPDRGRGHIFVWDVSRAMNCEVPHFVGVKELSLGQTVDWLRYEGPMQGWTRASPEDAVANAMKGMMVLALPREIRLKQLAVVMPVPAERDGRPKVAAAGVKIGNNLGLFDALGVYAADFLFHA